MPRSSNPEIDRTLHALAALQQATGGQVTGTVSAPEASDVARGREGGA
jgi:hypothetical protein